MGKLTQEEKVNLTAGVSVSNGCSGNIAAIERLDFPGFCVSDAGNGLVCIADQRAFCISLTRNREGPTMSAVGLVESMLELAGTEIWLNSAGHTWVRSFAERV